MGLRVEFRLFGAAAAAALSACATTPDGETARFADSLTLCGPYTDNPPPLDGRGEVADFTPLFHVNGRALARAPVPGCLSSGFGVRFGGAGARHDGLDIVSGGASRPFPAAGDGVVRHAGWMSGYGLTLIVDHGRGVETRYAHLGALARRVKPGARVRAGEILGRTGDSGNATGVHLHYEVRLHGTPVDPFSP